MISPIFAWYQSDSTCINAQTFQNAHHSTSWTCNLYWLANWKYPTFHTIQRREKQMNEDNSKVIRVNSIKIEINFSCLFLCECIFLSILRVILWMSLRNTTMNGQYSRASKKPQTPYWTTNRHFKHNNSRFSTKVISKWLTWNGRLCYEWMNLCCAVQLNEKTKNSNDNNNNNSMRRENERKIMRFLLKLKNAQCPTENTRWKEVKCRRKKPLVHTYRIKE